MPKVSIILTSFNHARFIDEAIDSVLRQTFTDFELLIIDDASTDDSWWRIQCYSDPRIKTFRNSKKNEITSKVVDIISSVALGEYIAVHHSDDVWEPEKLEKQIAILDRTPEIGVVFTNASAITSDGAPLRDGNSFYFNVFDQKNRTRHEWLRYFFSYGNALCHPSALIRKQCFEECGYYRPWLWQLDDFELWVRFSLKYEIHIISEKLTHFRVREQGSDLQVSADSRHARIRGAFEMLYVLDNYKKIPTFEDLYKIFPEARKYHREHGADLCFVVGLVMLECAPRTFAQIFALNLLKEAMSDTERAKNIRSVYDFEFSDLIRLTGLHDVFSIEELSDLRSLASQNSKVIEKYRLLVNERNDNIAELEATLQVNIDAVSARDARIAEYEADLQVTSVAISERDKLLAIRDTEVQSLAGKLADREKNVASLTQDSAEAREQARLLQDSIDALHCSTSWRLTFPLRFGVRQFRRVCRILRLVRKPQ